MSDQFGAPERQTIQRDPTRPRELRPVSELAEDTPLGNAYLASLLRVQFLLAVRMTLLLIAFLGGVVVMLLVTRNSHIAPFDVPINWLVLGILPFMVFALLARMFATRAERNEQDFVAVVTPTQSGQR